MSFTSVEKIFSAFFAFIFFISFKWSSSDERCYIKYIQKIQAMIVEIFKDLNVLFYC